MLDQSVVYTHNGITCTEQTVENYLAEACAQGRASEFHPRTTVDEQENRADGSRCTVGQENINGQRALWSLFIRNTFDEAGASGQLQGATET